MKKIKDFLYDYNDVLIAFALLIIAALVILLCMNSIIEYPKTLISEDPPAVDTPVEETPDIDEGTGDDIVPQEGDNESTDPQEDTQTSQLWSNGALSKDTQVKVAGNSAYAAVQCLVDAGLFKDYDEYRTICENLGLNHENVGAGTFTFPEGSTKEDVVERINLS